MVQAPARSLIAGMTTGPRYLLTSWPWRALAWTVFGGALSGVTLGMTPLLLLAFSRSLRTSLWSPLLEVEVARLSLIDVTAAERLKHHVSAARSEGRLPSVRQVLYVLFTALIAGPFGFLLAGFLAIVTGVLVAAPWLVRPGEPINVGLWLVDTPGESWAAFAAGIGHAILSAYVVGAYAGVVDG